MAAITSNAPTSTPPAANGQSYRTSFAIMTSLFFMWGFMTVFNDILIPRFKEAFTLNYFQAMLVQFAFFGAYFVGSLLYFIISATTGDPIAKIGYKNGVVIGLLISAAGSAIINYLGQPSVAGLAELEASKYVSIYWGGLMIGRFMGSVELSEIKAAKKQVLLIVIPLLAFLVLWLAKSAPLDAMHGNSDKPVMTLWADAFVANWAVFKMYLPFIALCWVLFQFGRGHAAHTLMIFSLTVVALLLTAILVGGKVAMWCVVAVGLFTSIGWSNTFSLALEGTGIYKSQVSSLLVMAILGGAVLPPLQGKIADVTHNLQISFIVPLIAYAYVAFYGAKGHSIGRKTTA